jgi:hypothetical protein
VYLGSQGGGQHHGLLVRVWWRAAWVVLHRAVPYDGKLFTSAGPVNDVWAISSESDEPAAGR